MALIANIEDFDRDGDRRHARKMLALLTPFGEWSRDGETVARAQMWLRIARHVLDIAALSPEERKREIVRLELDAAISFIGAEEVERS